MTYADLIPNLFRYFKGTSSMARIVEKEEGGFFLYSNGNLLDSYSRRRDAARGARRRGLIVA